MRRVLYSLLICALQLVPYCHAQIPEGICDDFYGPKCNTGDGVTLLTCANRVVGAQKCSALYPDKPCCVNDRCLADTPTSQCVAKGTRFTCTSMDYFPDPNNCRRYYICYEKGDAFVSYECPPFYVYDPQTDLCRRQWSTWDCRTINCAPYKNKYVLHPTDQSILAFCSDNGVETETILFRCPDHVNMQYDINTLSCSLKCKTEGRFADVSSCANYYECYWNYGTLVSVLQTCPPGYKFDDAKKVCAFDEDETCTSEVAARHARIRSLFLNASIPLT